MNRPCILVLCLVPVLGSAAETQADIYKWIDGSGGVHFTDQPPPGVESEKLELGVETFDAPVITESEYNAYQTSVVIYSTKWCNICTRATAYLREKQIPFVEYDVEDDPEGRREFAKLGGNGVPVILVLGRRLNGFSEKAFDRLYYR